MLFAVLVTVGVIAFLTVAVEVIKAVERHRLRRLGVPVSRRPARRIVLATSTHTTRFDQWWERLMPDWWIGWPTWFRNRGASLRRRLSR
jgi:hypothetical protein